MDLESEINFKQNKTKINTLFYLLLCNNCYLERLTQTLHLHVRIVCHVNYENNDRQQLFNIYNIFYAI